MSPTTNGAINVGATGHERTTLARVAASFASCPLSPRFSEHLRSTS